MTTALVAVLKRRCRRRRRAARETRFLDLVGTDHRALLVEITLHQRG
ncbi:hypothetical protein [Streptomyces sp. AC555_RSS877]|nr:hypothetical protein [Streptomyces sp. AC555_RSS877]